MWYGRICVGACVGVCLRACGVRGFERFEGWGGVGWGGVG